MIAFVKSFSRLVAKQNIRANCISPGNVFIEDGLWDRKMKENPNKAKSYLEKNVPLNCFVDVKDIVQAILFLENSQTVTGANFVIDAGQTIGY